MISKFSEVFRITSVQQPKPQTMSVAVACGQLDAVHVSGRDSKWPLTAANSSSYCASVMHSLDSQSLRIYGLQKQSAIGTWTLEYFG